MFTMPFIVMPFISGQSLPYMATPIRKIQHALQFIQKQQQQKKLIRNNHMVSQHTKHSFHQKIQRQFLDLGSGDGETIYQAMQLVNQQHDLSRNNTNSVSSNDDSYYYYTKCIGIELNTTLYVVSYLRRILFWKRNEQIRSQFLCRNMFHLSSYPNHNTNRNNLIHQSDTIYLFGIPSLMTPMSQLLLQNHCQPGTYVICYRFPLPIHDDNTNSNLLPAKLIYNQEEMRIYECIGNDTTKGEEDSIHM
jgi:hypothetical protein